MKRGDVYTAAAKGAYTGKPGPVVIVQDDRFDATASVTVCAITTVALDAPLMRIHVEPSPANGLIRPSELMVDKVADSPGPTFRSTWAGFPMRTLCDSTAL